MDLPTECRNPGGRSSDPSTPGPRRDRVAAEKGNGMTGTQDIGAGGGTKFHFSFRFDISSRHYKVLM
ncbi:MAG: hypothetical protein ACU0A0_10180 [Limimaricola sp.]